MRKFGVVFKEKQNILEKVQEQKLLGQFKNVYSLLLENYGVSEFYNLNEETQDAFLNELNKYWTEDEGITQKGNKFLKTKQTTLTESSTLEQKSNFLKRKATLVINETFRQSNLKTNLYKVLDEMYRRTNAEDINDVLNPNDIAKTIAESFSNSLGDLMTEIIYELTDSNLNENEFSKKKEKN